MKLPFKSFFALVFILSFSLPILAQKKVVFITKAYLNNHEIIKGKLSNVNDTAIFITDRQGQIKQALFKNLVKIKVLKHHNDLGYGLITGALAVGAVGLAQTVDDGGKATLIGVGGTIAIVGLGAALHSVFHPAAFKVENKKEAITFANTGNKLSPYINK